MRSGYDPEALRSLRRDALRAGSSRKPDDREALLISIGLGKPGSEDEEEADEKMRRSEVRNQNAQRFDEMERRNVDPVDGPSANDLEYDDEDLFEDR